MDERLTVGSIFKVLDPREKMAVGEKGPRHKKPTRPMKRAEDIETEQPEREGHRVEISI
jgi:hypothetical protein